jgi:aspartyl-tRNA(Asn)/glutamyl-tRNA(Gln) amidotransferase subunit A
MGLWEERIRKAGAHTESVHADFWQEAYDIYAPIQAREASALHAGYYDEFEPAIAERLRWGASMSHVEVAEHRARHESFVRRSAALFAQLDFLMLPVLPVTRLAAGADNSGARPRILRYTTPASLCGLPAAVLPARPAGMQLLAGRGRDADLLAFAKILGEACADEVGS